VYSAILLDTSMSPWYDSINTWLVHIRHTHAHTVYGLNNLEHWRALKNLLKQRSGYWNITHITSTETESLKWWIIRKCLLSWQMLTLCNMKLNWEPLHFKAWIIDYLVRTHFGNGSVVIHVFQFCFIQLLSCRCRRPWTLPITACLHSKQTVTVSTLSPHTKSQKSRAKCHNSTCRNHEQTSLLAMC
jgi:hypothetical protein